MKTILSIAATATLGLLTACGGGGDSGQNPFVRPTESFNALAAWKNLLAADRHVVLNGTATSDAGTQQATVDLTLAPGNPVQAIFPPDGVSYKRAVVTSTINITGYQPAGGASENFYDRDFKFVGSRDTDVSGTPVTCTQSTSKSLPPTAVKIDEADQSGPLHTSDDLPDCAKKVVNGTTTTRWSLEYKAGITYFCTRSINTNLKDPPTVITETDCVQVAPDGALGSLVQVTLTLPDDAGHILTIDVHN